MDWMPNAIRDGILAVLFVSGPIVILAAVLGLAVGILQAATQIQEQTLGSAIKIVGVFMALIIGGVWMFSYLNKFASTNFNRAFKLIPTLTAHPLPPLFRFAEESYSSKKLKEQERELNDNEPYNFRPPDVEAPEPNAPTGKSGTLVDIATKADPVPINVGQRQPVEKSPVPPRAELPDLSTQDLVPVNVTPLAAPAAEPSPAPAQTTTRPATTSPVRAPQTTTAPAAPRNTAPAPAPSPRPQTAPRPRPTANTAAPRTAPPPKPRKRLKRSSIGNITDRIQNSIDNLKE